MKFSSSLLLSLALRCWFLLEGVPEATAFLAASSSGVQQQQQRRVSLKRPLAATNGSQNAEVEALLAAAAKAREEANRLSMVRLLTHFLLQMKCAKTILWIRVNDSMDSCVRDKCSSHDQKILPISINQELGKPVAESTSSSIGAASSPTNKKSADEIQSLIPSILAETNLAEQASAWQALKDNRSVSAFGSAVLRTYPVSLRMLEDRTGLTAETLGLSSSDVDLDDFKYATLYVTGGATVAGIASLAFLPPNVGATICYLCALIPIAFLAVGSTAPAAIADAIATVKGGSGGSDGVTSQDRVVRHEAAHFCCGYWCGLPVSQYSVQDGVARVEFDVASTSSYSSTEIAALSVTALAGLVGEAAQYNKAVGAAQDLMVLDGVLRRSKEFIGAAAQQDLTRWGALTAALLLKQNAAQYEKVVAAFQRQAGIDECVALLES